jgi:hypothetical protein
MNVYHGSYTAISLIDLSKCEKHREREHEEAIPLYDFITQFYKKHPKTRENEDDAIEDAYFMRILKGRENDEIVPNALNIIRNMT